MKTITFTDDEFYLINKLLRNSEDSEHKLRLLIKFNKILEESK